MRIDPDSPEHPYEQLAAHLRSQIADGTITSRNPSYSALMDRTRLSLGVVQRVVKVPAGEGRVFIVPGRGVFVRNDQRAAVSRAATGPARRPAKFPPAAEATREEQPNGPPAAPGGPC